MKTLTFFAAGVAALALAACTDTTPEETSTAAAMPDTSVDASPAPDAGETGLAGEGASPVAPAAPATEGAAETDENLPPVNLPNTGG
ncbi:hypothetical protein [Phenylobacterium sp.]|uniref:hypothetical protein n=1 Tax=Phenylobacterium sp. TaxID=1871053 RepID=UPI0027303C5E|nr:hypothetical protein [Phenylobacterium sp.]MDP1618393.1 hypothetical protein [Phenylobacterium sp.]MDP1988637.1 hypothetical protein [Phenylobacterium sp.]